MVDLATISLALQTISVMSVATAAIIGLRSYINSNKRTEEAKKKEQETRERELETGGAQLFMQVFSLNCSEEATKMWYKVYNSDTNNIEDYLQKTGWRGMAENLDTELANSLAWIITHYEGMGLLAKRGLIDMGMLTEMFSAEVIGACYLRDS
jgi:hypothetical protein